MATAAVLNPEDLLDPIPGDNPCGESLRWDPVYDEIRASRRQDDRDALVENFAGGADWPRVIELASEALNRRSKDLQLAAWLTEALTYQNGFAGFRDGLSLINGLLERFWENLHPEIEEEDLEPRVAPLLWLTDADRGARLPNTLREIALAPGDGEETYSYTFWKSRYPQPQGETEDEESYNRRVQEAEGRAKRFEDAVADQSTDYYVHLQDDLQQCLDEVQSFSRRVDEAFGRIAPGTSALRQSLEDCAVLVRRILKDKGYQGAAEEESPADGNGQSHAQAAAAGTARAADGPIKSREDAMRRLQEVATYLRQTDPHSPVSYLIQRAVNWSRMPLEKLLGELVQDAETRNKINEMLGIRASEEMEE